MIENKKPEKKPTSKRSMARLAAVQACYVIHFGSSVDSVINDFKNETLGGYSFIGREDNDFEEKIKLAPMDKELFEKIVRNVSTKIDDLTTTITPHLSENWHPERLDLILKMILICGCYELFFAEDVPIEVIISEYIGIAAAFYNGSELGLVNAVLEQIAKDARKI